MKKTFLLLLLANSGVTLTPELKAKVEAAADTDVLDLPELETQLANSLLGIETAKKHPDLINHFKGELYTPTDQAVRASLIEAGFTEEAAKKLTDGKTAVEKISIAAKAIKEKTGKPAGETSEEIKNLTKVLNDEKAARAQEKTAFENDLATARNEFAAFKNDVNLEKYFTQKAGFKLRSDLPQAKILKLIKEDLSEFAKENGFEIGFNEAGEPVLKNTKTPEADIYINNAKVTDLKDIAANILTANKYLDTADHAGGEVKTHTVTGGTSYANAAAQANHEAIATALNQG